MSGGKDLKHSQHYPALLGEAVAEMYASHIDEIHKNVSERKRLDSRSLAGLAAIFTYNNSI